MTSCLHCTPRDGIPNHPALSSQSPRPTPSPGWSPRLVSAGAWDRRQVCSQTRSAGNRCFSRPRTGDLPVLVGLPWQPAGGTGLPVFAQPLPDGPAGTSRELPREDPGPGGGGERQNRRPALYSCPWPTNTVPAHYRYLTFASMCGVLLPGPYGTASTPPSRQPHVCASTSHWDRSRPLS